MNIGIRLHDTTPGIFWDRLSSARRQGFTCVQLELSRVLPHFDTAEAPLRLNAHLAEQVRCALQIQGMYCAVLDCGLEPSDGDAERLGRTLEVYRAHLRFARMMGAELVGVRMPTAPGPDPSGEALARFLRCAAPLGRFAEEEDALLAIEPGAGRVVDTPEKAERVLYALGGRHVRVILDAADLPAPESPSEDALGECLRRLGDRVSVLRLRDVAPGSENDAPRDALLRFAIERELPVMLEGVTPENAEAARLRLERAAARLFNDRRRGYEVHRSA